MGQHAILSASASKRWMNCTPSALLEKQFADEEPGQVHREAPHVQRPGPVLRDRAAHHGVGLHDAAQLLEGRACGAGQVVGHFLVASYASMTSSVGPSIMSVPLLSQMVR